MVVSGGDKAISGIIGQRLARRFSGCRFAGISALAWSRLIEGVILLFAGRAVLNGKAWGHWVGVSAAGIAIIAELLRLRVCPVRSSLLITLSMSIAIGLVR